MKKTKKPTVCALAEELEYFRERLIIIEEAHERFKGAFLAFFGNESECFESEPDEI